ncbi:hypothetical protein GCM10028864_68610 [Microlunatus parietis]
MRPSEGMLSDAAARYAAGETLRSIAGRLGISRERLSRCLQDRGVRLRRQGPSEAQVWEMKDRYLRGQSLARIGAVLGFDATTVRTHLLRADVALRDPQGRER